MVSYVCPSPLKQLVPHRDSAVALEAIHPQLVAASNNNVRVQNHREMWCYYHGYYVLLRC